MLISLSFTTAESVVVSFNQKTQYDSVWQGLFLILMPLLVPKLLLLFDELEQSGSRWQCCSSAVPAQVSWPLLRPNID